MRPPGYHHNGFVATHALLFCAVLVFLVNIKEVWPKILESLAGCLTELCTSDFYWIFSSFQRPLIFSLRYQFPTFFQTAFQADEHPPV